MKLLFETRDTAPSSMYIFAAPISDEEFEQSQTYAASEKPASSNSSEPPVQDVSADDSLTPEEEVDVDDDESLLDKTESNEPVMGWKLLTPSFVNGTSVPGPVILDPDAQWTIVPALVEIPEGRARVLYRKCVARRVKALTKDVQTQINMEEDKDKDPEKKPNTFHNAYRARLHEFAIRGRAELEKIQEIEKQRKNVVWGLDDE